MQTSVITFSFCDRFYVMMADWKTFIQHEKNQWTLDDEILLHFEEVPYEEALKFTGYTRVGC